MFQFSTTTIIAFSCFYIVLFVCYGLYKKHKDNNVENNRIFIEIKKNATTFIKEEIDVFKKEIIKYLDDNKKNINQIDLEHIHAENDEKIEKIKTLFYEKIDDLNKQKENDIFYIDFRYGKRIDGLEKMIKKQSTHINLLLNENAKKIKYDNTSKNKDFMNEDCVDGNFDDEFEKDEDLMKEFEKSLQGTELNLIPMKREKVSNFSKIVVNKVKKFIKTLNDEVYLNSMNVVKCNENVYFIRKTYVDSIYKKYKIQHNNKLENIGTTKLRKILEHLGIECEKRNKKGLLSYRIDFSLF